MGSILSRSRRDLTELRERVKAGIVHARQSGRPHGRPRTAAKHTARVKQIFAQGISKAEIARRLGISRTSVRRLLDEGDGRVQTT